MWQSSNLRGNSQSTVRGRLSSSLPTQWLWDKSHRRTPVLELPKDTSLLSFLLALIHFPNFLTSVSWDCLSISFLYTSPCSIRVSFREVSRLRKPLSRYLAPRTLFCISWDFKNYLRISWVICLVMILGIPWNPLGDDSQLEITK